MRRSRSWTARLALAVITLMAVASLAVVAWVHVQNDPESAAGSGAQPGQPARVSADKTTRPAPSIQSVIKGDPQFPDSKQAGKDPGKGVVVIDGVLSPGSCELLNWDALETRVMLNLVHELLDLSKALIAQGKLAPARAAVREARDLEIKVPVPSPITVVEPGQPPPPAKDTRRKGSKPPPVVHIVARISAAALANYILFPLPETGVIMPLRGDRMVNTALWRLLQARQLRTSDARGSASAAREAADLLSRSLPFLLKEASARPTDHSIVAMEAYLSGDPQIPSFPWGWFSVDFALARLAGYLKEAAGLSGDPAVMKRAGVIQGRVARLLQERKKPGNWELPAWTNERRLGRPPT